MHETYSDIGPLDLSVVLPCFNEEEAVVSVIQEIRLALKDWPGTWEILVVDDGSTDSSAERAEKQGVRVIRRIETAGSGASRKIGIRAARGELVAMLDADGSYAPEHLPELLARFPDYDQVNGARTSEQGSLKPLRIVAKWLIRKLAEWITGKRIPDLNTGMKVFKRSEMLRYLWVLPDGFSCVSSMTLAFMTNGHPVAYCSVKYRPRIGQSKFHPVRDTAAYLATVIRMVVYFRPLRFFMPVASLLLLAAVVKGYYDVVLHPARTLQESDIILVTAALLMAAIGMLADLIVAQRRERSETGDSRR